MRGPWYVYIKWFSLESTTQGVSRVSAAIRGGIGTLPPMNRTHREKMLYFENTGFNEIIQNMIINF